jgi:hypothetical protein
MFAGFAETFLKNGGQPLLYQYTKKETEITQMTIEVLVYLNTGYKIYSKITANRLTATAEVLLLEEQNGFRKGRSWMDCIFSASQIIEKHREFNIPTYIAFIDFNKAFDSVNRGKLWTITLSKGIPTHLTYSMVQSPSSAAN